LLLISRKCTLDLVIFLSEEKLDYEDMYKELWRDLIAAKANK
jgi:hypothetical protein